MTPFDRLERDLVGAARRRAAPARRAPRALVAPLTAALALACAAAAAAATYLAVTASGIAPVRDAALPPEQRVAPGSGRLLDVRAEDPVAGRPPWGMRLARSRTGLLCGTVGQVVDGKLGVVGLDDRFRALPDANADACGAEVATGVSLLATRIFEADGYDEVRTVVNGVAGRDLERVTIALRGGPARAVEHSPEGAFVLAAQGYPEDLAPRITFRWRDGRTRTETLAASPNVFLDLAGGPAWAVASSSSDLPGKSRKIRLADGSIRRIPRFTCVNFRPARQTGAYGPFSPGLCGRAGFRGTHTFFYGTRRLAGDRSPGAGVLRRGDWNGAPARTAVWGNVSTLARRVIATAPGGVRGEARIGRGGSFVIALPGSVDPASVRIELRMRDGRIRRTGPNAGLVDPRRAMR
jgi:hypothetical protein